MSQPILEVENVSQRFGNFTTFNKVSVAFQPGKLTAIIGPNGQEGPSSTSSAEPLRRPKAVSAFR
ncbi:hypothetical protein ACVBEH_13525 [Roseateles sp. GG27B]